LNASRTTTEQTFTFYPTDHRTFSERGPPVTPSSSVATICQDAIFGDFRVEEKVANLRKIASPNNATDDGGHTIDAKEGSFRIWRFAERGARRCKRSCHTFRMQDPNDLGTAPPKWVTATQKIRISHEVERWRSESRTKSPETVKEKTTQNFLNNQIW